MNKKTITVFTSLLLLQLLGAQFSIAFAQGTLTPPGPPAPTMISLGQIEPRTPISSAPFIITQSGSYYLTTNLTVTGGSGNTNGISINANSVTLDLNGFKISSTTPSAAGYGIEIGASVSVTNVTIFNGYVFSGVTDNGAGTYSGSGFACGIAYLVNARNVHVHEVSVTGCLIDGIYLPINSSTTVVNCSVNEVGSYGIFADSVTRSTASGCGADGIIADSASDCVGSGAEAGVYGNGPLNNCYGSSLAGTGIYGNGNVNNCEGITVSGFGIQCSASVFNSVGYSSGNGTAINGYLVGNCYGSCPSGSGAGIVCYMVNNSYGLSHDGSGISASDLAFSSYGSSYSGYGITAYVANFCEGVNGSGYSISATYANYSY
jgi:hypothetical protein